jgi:transposase
VTEGDGWIRVRAGTPGGPLPCPVCGIETSRVHAHDDRIVADVPLDGRRLRIVVGIRRLRCAAVDCARETFRWLLPGVLERYQRHTPRLAGQIGAVVRGRS